MSQTYVELRSGKFIQVHLSGDAVVPRWGLWRVDGDSGQAGALASGMFGWNLGLLDALDQYESNTAPHELLSMEPVAEARFILVDMKSLPLLRGPSDTGALFYGR